MTQMRAAVAAALMGMLVAGCSGPAGTCKSDSDCSKPTPRCDVGGNQCVPCLPTNDNCDKPNHCAAMGRTFACVTTCNVVADCGSTGGNACCSGNCVDSTKDIHNCGGCGLACPTPDTATVMCNAGNCAVGTCSTGTLDCDGKVENGCEVTAATDVKNCGVCGTACKSGAHGSAACTSGKCALNCEAGFADCNGDATDGCEVVVATDVKNCGTCGMACTPPPNSTMACVAGKCVVATCIGWFADCDKNPANGCEADTKGDVANCGGCGSACPAVQNGHASCTGGLCGIGSCNMPFQHCSMNAADGCEDDGSSDSNNCGSCGHRCVAPDASESCVKSMCTVTSCSMGFGDCDKMAGNGCEVNFSNDAGNCGSCGAACPPLPHTDMVVCLKAACSPGQCSMGYSHCTMTPSDGCETDITTVTNCGKCGVVCTFPNAVPACKVGACALSSCNAGFLNCNGNSADGCEVVEATDVKNCGKCGNRCTAPPHAMPSCAAGVCGVGGCEAGSADCNGDPADGCESQIDVDPANCGKCGNACGGPTPDCIQGACSVSIHNSIAWDYANNPVQGYDYIYNDIALYSYIELGGLPWRDCMRQASMYGAMVQSAMDGQWNWFTPGWYGDRNGGQAMYNYFGRGNDSVDNYDWCVLVRDPQSGQTNNNPLSNVIIYDGQQWNYQDYGATFYDECQLNAGQAGASIITPWTLGLGNGDNYWEGVGDTYTMYYSSTNNGNDSNYNYLNDNFDRGPQYSCMVGYPVN
jgi:hypothetical protein